jgi:hypothetical protein
MGTYAFIYAGDPAIGETIFVEGDLRERLFNWLGKQTKPLTVPAIRAAIASKTGEARRATVTIKVAKFTCDLDGSDGKLRLSAAYAPKPRVNEIKDFRTRLPPFGAGGGCRV